MRWIVYLALIAGTMLAPVERADVAKLQPVETVAVYLKGDAVVLETDTGDKGQGSTAEEALADLKERACSVIYLDTAEYLLVARDAVSQADSLRPYLKSGVKVAPYSGGDIQDETAYWEVHGELPKLGSWKPLE